MTDNDKLIAHILDLKEKCALESVVTYSSFLSLNEISEIRKTERINNNYVDTYYYGGYDDAERKAVIFIPRFYGVSENKLQDFLNEEECNPLQLLRINKDKFSSLTHRDYLGAVMGLGLKREVVGDILPDDNGCYIFCLDSISSYIVENLKQTGRGQVDVSVADICSFKAVEGKTEIFFASVASLRLDCLVSSAFSISRSGAVEAINRGLVYVNSVQILKTDFTLKKGDKLVFRGKGKTVIDEILGENKKGRLHINIKRYL